MNKIIDPKKHLPGLRIIKTFIAVLICLVTLYAFKYYNPIYAAISCVLMMKSTVEESFNGGKYRIIGTILGGIVSLILLNFIRFINLSHESYFTVLIISFGVMIVLMVTKITNANSNVGSMAGVVLLITMLAHSSATDNTFMYVFIRVLETIYGIVIAVIINRHFNFFKNNN